MSQSYVQEKNGPVTQVTHKARILPMKDRTIFSSTDGPLPRRKRKPKPDPLERFEPYLALRASVLGGKFKPMEEKGIFIRPTDKQITGTEFPWRVVADHLRHAIREAGLESDFSVVKYETDTPGVWFVKVRYEPPLSKARHG